MTSPRLPTVLAVCLLTVPVLAGPLQDPQASGEDTITLNVQGTALGEVLKLISVQQHVNIVVAGDTTVPVSANFYDASLEDALDWILTSAGMGWFYDGKVYQVMAIDALEAVARPLSHLVIQPNYISARELQEFLTQFLSSHGRILVTEEPSVGIASGSDDTGGISSAMRETLVVIDNEEALERVASIAEELDQRPRQVLVEAAMIEVVLDETNKFGIDFNILGGVDFSQFESLTAPGQVYSDATALVPGGLGAAGQAAGAPFLTPSGTKSFGTSGFTFPKNNDGFRIGWVGSGAAIFIEALQEIADTNVLANTKVLSLNKQMAEIIIGGRLGFFGGTTVSQGISQQTVEFLDVGTQLRFRPFVFDDGWVRMEIHPERSAGVVDPVTGLPTETTSEVTTNVMVRDGQTVMIGGLIETRDVSITKKVPILGDIPGIGALFRSNETQVKRTEIIVLLTPHVLESGETYEDYGQVLADANRDADIHRDTFGAKARATHARRYLEEARQALDRGNLEDARSLCDRSLMINPLAPGAIDLSVQIDSRLQELQVGRVAYSVFDPEAEQELESQDP